MPFAIHPLHRRLSADCTSGPDEAHTCGWLGREPCLETGGLCKGCIHEREQRDTDEGKACDLTGCDFRWILGRYIDPLPPGRCCVPSHLCASPVWVSEQYPSDDCLRCHAHREMPLDSKTDRFLCKEHLHLITVCERKYPSPSNMKCREPGCTELGEFVPGSKTPYACAMHGGQVIGNRMQFPTAAWYSHPNASSIWTPKRMRLVASLARSGFEGQPFDEGVLGKRGGYNRPAGASRVSFIQERRRVPLARTDLCIDAAAAREAVQSMCVIPTKERLPPNTPQDQYVYRGLL